MASQMIHLEIGYRLAKRLGIKEGLAEFILGSVAPDSVFFSDNYLERKIHSHIFEGCGPWGDTQDYERWIRNIREFSEKYVVSEEDAIKKAFLRGICVHCITDYWNDLLIWRALQRKMIPPMTYETFREEYYPESRKIDAWLYQNSENSEVIMKLLADSKVMDFEDYVRADEIEQMKDHLKNTQYNLPDPIDVSEHKYYKKDMLIQFLEEVTDKLEVDDIINKVNN